MFYPWRIIRVGMIPFRWVNVIKRITLHVSDFAAEICEFLSTFSRQLF